MVERGLYARIDDLVATVDWKATDPEGYYKDVPHEYVMTHWSEDAEKLWLLLRVAILEDGYDANFGGRTFRYLNRGDHRYWYYSRGSLSTAGPKVLNRAELQ